MEQQKQEFAVESAESKSIEIISRKEAKALGLKRYFTGIPCKNNHIAERRVSDWKCVTCGNDCKKRGYESNREVILSRCKKYREKNKDRLSEYFKEYHKKNSAKKTSIASDYYRKNKKYVIDRVKSYQLENKDKTRSYKNKYKKNNKPAEFIRSALVRVEKNWKGGRWKYEKVLGYTAEDLKKHIESQFVSGMSWDNRSEWHIDHIKPIIAFLNEGITDLAIINALSNLQPLWAVDNLRKGAKYNAKDS